MNDSPVTTAPRYRWARSGDINAFFGLMLDNVAGLILMACLPALAFLALHMPGRMMPAVAADQVAADVQRDLLTMRMLSNSFILTSLLWAWALVAVIDRRLLLAAAVFAVTGVFTLFGVIHSPATTNSVALPFGPQAWAGMVLPAEHRGLVYEYAAGYLAVTILLLLWAKVPGASRATDPPLHDG